MSSKEQIISSSDALLLYFSHDGCNVCKVLRPKLECLLNDNYPKFKFTYINTVEQPEVAAQFQVFTVPTVLVYFEGKEYFRFSRNIGLSQLEDAIKRPYHLLFD